MNVDSSDESGEDVCPAINTTVSNALRAHGASISGAIGRGADAPQPGHPAAHRQVGGGEGVGCPEASTPTNSQRRELPERNVVLEVPTCGS